MNMLLDWLRGGDLRSDGDANEAVREVIAHPQLFEWLLEGLQASEDVVRGRTADALEKVSRSHPELLAPHLAQLIELATSDSVAMVRWHLAMILGTLGALGHRTERITSTLIELLADRSAFVKSWAIASLALVGREHPQFKGEIIPALGALRNDRSIAVRARVSKALAFLERGVPIPEGWTKCRALRRQQNGGAT
jgi:HEAT repeat protein